MYYSCPSGQGCTIGCSALLKPLFGHYVANLCIEDCLTIASLAGLMVGHSIDS
jgi:hypothetical protein